MKKIFIYLAISLSLAIYACGNNSNNNSSIVGTWNEYRANGDNYLLSSWEFNADGSGLFTIRGYSGTQKIAFSWKSISDSKIEVYMDGNYQILQINNGLLIEESSCGTIIFKK